MPAPLPSFVDANQSFVAWLRGQLALVEVDLEFKHGRMTTAEFPFLRATFFRWAQTWPLLCPHLAAAPTVLAVGDLHVENFGTWRDADSRLVWGINDFDEAYPMPYTSDLVRLAVSACLAIGKERLKPESVSTSILSGYQNALNDGGAPFLLAEQNKMLRHLAEKQIKNAAKFWKKLKGNDLPNEPAPAEAVALLETSLPEQGLTYQLMHRRAGLGSLGRQRFVALSSWRGGMLAREAKPLVLSACLWANPNLPRREILIRTVIGQAVRCPDPALRFSANWMARRLAPDCVKIEVKDEKSDRDILLPEELPGLLGFIGAETANIHLGSPGARQILSLDLDKRLTHDKDWFLKAVDVMLDQVRSDFREWKQSRDKLAAPPA